MTYFFSQKNCIIVKINGRARRMIGFNGSLMSWMIYLSEKVTRSWSGNSLIKAKPCPLQPLTYWSCFLAIQAWKKMSFIILLVTYSFRSLNLFRVKYSDNFIILILITSTIPNTINSKLNILMLINHCGFIISTMKLPTTFYSIFWSYHEHHLTCQLHIQLIKSIKLQILHRNCKNWRSRD